MRLVERIRRGTAALFAAAGLLALAPGGAAADPNGDAVRAVNSFDPGNELTHPPLEDVIDAGQADVFALAPQLKSGKLARRWAAMYVAHNLARREADYRRLRPRLRDKDPSIRAMAAFALIGAGKKEAIPILISSLSSPRFMLYGEPPRPIAALADDRLVRRTRADFRFDFYGRDKARQKAIRAWKKWWGEVKRNIRWDRAAKRFRWRRERSGRRASARSAAPATTGAFATAGASFGPPTQAPKSTGSTAGDSTEITVNIELSPGSGRDAGSVDKVLELKEAAESFLNGPNGRTGGCVNIKFKLNLQPRQGSGTPGFHQFKVLSGTSDRYRRAFVMGLPDPGKSTTGQLLDGGSAKVLVHEALHLMGLDDEYTDRPDGYSEPHDPDSVMGDHQFSQLLQRHLDFLAERFDTQDQKNCQKYSLKFARWLTEGNPQTVPSGGGQRYIIGLSATATVASDFWFNPRTGVITPAGDMPCGELNLRKRCPEDIEYPATPGFGGGGGNSTSLDGRASHPSAPCDDLELRHSEKYFTTTVSGSKQGDAFALNLKVDDAEDALYYCDPPANPSFENRTLISDGMAVAKNSAGQTALSFKTAIPAVNATVGPTAFRFDGGDGRAEGDLEVRRIK